jgi:tRNA(Arg) A34 adenosine deaminase TadA
LTFDEGRAVHMGDSFHPPRPSEGRLNELWEAQVKDLVLLPLPNLSPEQLERHNFYCDLLLALVAHYWNGNKKGRYGNYPWREKQKIREGEYAGGDYLGHNIACIAVDAEGEVIDFDFNHNEVLNSSVEHAESRLIRRVFSLTQLHNGWATGEPASLPKPIPYSNVLNDVSVYTSLESCSQCSGIMALGSVKEVIFLQRDPGQSSIGNILRNLSPISSTYKPPLPIPGNALGLSCFDELGRHYEEFAREASSRPFYTSPDGAIDKSASITSFLCNDDAREVFLDGMKRFETLNSAKYPTYKPRRPNGQEIPKALSNQDVIAYVHRFFGYAIGEGRRGTPHKL